MKTKSSGVLNRITVNIEIKAAPEGTSGAEGRTFEGLASVWEKDLGNDVIHKGAFKNTIKEWKASNEAMPLLNSHDHWNIMSALGQAIDLKETDKGLWSKWEVLDGPEGDAVLRRLRPSPTTKRAVVGKMSIGFEPLQWTFEKAEGQMPWEATRHLTEIDLKEVSLVLFPMAPGASVDASSVKTMEMMVKSADPSRTSPETFQELRRLSTYIGHLLKKQHSPVEGEQPPADDPPVVEDPPESNPQGTPPEAPAPADDIPKVDVPAPPVEVEPGPSGETEGKTYQFAEALELRMRRTLLKRKMTGELHAS